MDLITCTNLTVGYEDKIVLNNLSFSISNGTYVYVVGANGTGKSTLIKALLKLKKPLSGSVTYCPQLKQNEIGYMPQQTDAQRDFPASVREIVLSGCLNKLGLNPFYGRRQLKKAQHTMELLDITDLQDKSYQDLSGGQQQRTLLARSLCASSKALLLDEPVTGLDPKVTSELYELIYRLNRDYRITVITVSHDLDAALRYGTHILHLDKDGYFYGTTDAYQNSRYYHQFRPQS